jgi:predicted transcriptional regulator
MNLLGSNMELAEKKLILLYIIEKIDMPVSNLQMTKIILENNYMNYFLMQQFLNELCESNLLSAEIIDNKTSYLITGYGRQTLEYFIKLIPKGIKNRIDNTISSIRKNVRNETLITADFIPESENEYIASCSVHEDNFSLIDLKITVGTKSDARIICDNWKKHTQAIYAEIIEILTRKREED